MSQASSDATETLRARVAETQRLHAELLRALDEDRENPNLGLAELPEELTLHARPVSASASVPREIFDPAALDTLRDQLGGEESLQRYTPESAEAANEASGTGGGGTETGGKAHLDPDYKRLLARLRVAESELNRVRNTPGFSMAMLAGEAGATGNVGYYAGIARVGSPTREPANDVEPQQGSIETPRSPTGVTYRTEFEHALRRADHTARERLSRVTREFKEAERAWAERLTDLEDALDEAIAERNELAGKIDGAEAKEKEAREMKERVGSWEESKAAFEKRLGALVRERDEALRAMHADPRSSRVVINKLTAEVAELGKALERGKSALKRAREKNARLVADNAELVRIKAGYTKSLAAKEIANRSLREALESSMASCTELDGAVKTLTEEREALQAEKLEIAMRARDEHKARVEAEARADNATRAAREAVASEESARKRLERCDELERAIAAQRVHISDQSREMAALRENLERCIEMARNREEEYMLDREDSDRHVASLEDELAAIKADIDTAQELKRERDQLAARVRHLEGECEELKIAASEAHEDAQYARRNREVAGGAVASLRDECARAEARARDLGVANLRLADALSSRIVGPRAQAIGREIAGLRALLQRHLDIHTGTGNNSSAEDGKGRERTAATKPPNDNRNPNQHRNAPVDAIKQNEACERVQPHPPSAKRLPPIRQGSSGQTPRMEPGFFDLP